MTTYRFSPGFVLRWLATAALRRRRDAARDGAAEFARCRPPPRAIDLDHVPQQGPFIVVMNHYERPGLRMWWSAWLVSSMVGRRRAAPGIRWMITDRFSGYRLLGITVVPEAAIARLLRLVARSYELLLVSRERVGPRAPMLREAYRALHVDGRPVGLAPEAGNAEGVSPAMVRAVAGSGSVIAWLSAGRVPVVPVAVYEDEAGALTARFGPPFTLQRRGGRNGERDTEALTDRVMLAVAALLPVRLRGAYGADGADAP